MIKRPTPHSMPAVPSAPDPRRTSVSQRARVVEQELRLDAARAGLDDAELAAVTQMLRAGALPAGGLPAFTEAEELQQLEAIAEGVRKWIEVRAELRRRAP